ncbi:hypothetical protein FHX74_002305 [Friedmanniella endophytica]|uniref:Helicase XPB/Ssl2 N-terminal domain-containing protein n=1 Tax=Microlunatus kandeliicorticis TaxID=1759536 RepID=A0A7W3P648_9ACTN|nr:helicase-associated domain-containing protein [Microlunatus kandeliicorticis]MBA8794686.1 hypothetical protein [Microlunatus kandeliicorticis]
MTRTGSSASATPRSLGEAVRGLDRDGLVALLRARPDLSYPLPRDLTELATQAATSPSVRRAVDRLDAWQRHVLEALACGDDPCTLDDLLPLLAGPGVTRAAVAAAVDALRTRALLWGPDDGLRLVRAVREHLGAYPGGLAPPSSRPLPEAEIAAEIEAAGVEAAAVLRRLQWGPPTGAVRDAERAVSVAQARTPVERLLARRLLRPQGPDTVVLPREVALHLRARDGGGLLAEHPPAPTPPVLSAEQRDVARTDRAATGAALAALHDVDVVVQAVAEQTLSLLRDGRLATRDLTTVARLLAAEADYATFAIELAAAADLIEGRPGLRLQATTVYDRWAAADAPTRWRRLADAWLGADRYFLAAAADGGRPLGPEAGSSRARETRALVLDCVATLPPGSLVDVDPVVELARWRRPALARPERLLRQVVEWTWREAEWLGLSALGATSTHWSLLARRQPLTDALAGLFPDPIREIVIQSDLTAVAPGPLAHDVATDLRLMADEESRGGGAVYRFGPTSIRRAFDAGWAAQQLHAWLAEHSVTPVPQPLSYLVDDVARQHGSIRVGPAEAVLRIEDPAQQASLLGHPEAGALRLRVLAPGVLASGAPPEEVVRLLQRIGLTPIAEDDDGRVLSARPPERAVLRREQAPRLPEPEEVADAVLAADARRGSVPEPDTAGALELLTDAARAGRPVRIGWVDPDGDRTERVLDGLSLSPGLVRATDPATDETVSIPLARISVVRPTD